VSPKKHTLEETIGYHFKDRELYNQAVTHSSCFNEKRDAKRSDNEKLEFLGDAILNTVISIILYKRFRGRDEGFLSNARSSLVKRETLTAIAKDIKLDQHMSYGNGDGTVPEESKVLSNMVEAVIGAVYLDSGIRNASKVIRKLFSAFFTEEKLTEKNPKNTLQELSQKKWGMLPRYKFPRKTKDGFAVMVFVGKEYKARGAGKSKKEAEQSAARTLLEVLAEQEEDRKA
jgi:ribonuclease III